MASGYSTETQCSTYIYQRLYYSTTADSTGHNVYVELQMRRTNSYGLPTFQYPSSSNISIDGNNQTWNWDSNNYPSIPGNNTNWLVFASRTYHVTHTSAKTITISGANTNMGQYLTGSTSMSITLESIQTVAPDTPTVSAATDSYNSINVTWGVASFGNPSTGTAYLYGGTSPSPTTEIYTRTTTGSALWTNSNLSANTRYYYRARAKNTADLWSLYSDDSSAVTKAAAPTVSIYSTTAQAATISWSTAADGGEYDKVIEYSLNGSTWYTGVTVTGGTAQSGNFAVSGLTPQTSYTIYTRVTTTAGSTTGTTLSATTTNNMAVMYGSVSDLSKKVTKIYGSVDFMTDCEGTITRNDNSFIASFDKSTFLAKMTSDKTSLLFKDAVDWSKMYLRVIRGPGTSYTLSIATSGIPLYNILAYTKANAEAYGFSFNTSASLSSISYVTIGSITWTPSTKEIKEIYGSLNGLSKIIYG